MMMLRRLLPLFLLLLLALPVKAQEGFEALAPGLAGGFGSQAETADKLGALGDPRAIPLLQALGEGRLFKAADGSLVVQEAGKAPPTDAEQLRVNNRVRVALRGAMGRLQLVSPDPAARLAAADALSRSRSAENIPVLEAAFAKETDPTVKERLGYALAASRLMASDAETKRKGIGILAETSTQDARALLLEARNADASLAPEIDAALAGIDRKLAVRRLAETVFQGVSLGSVLLLAALGLAVTFGVMGVINMAHGEFVMLGAYATVMVQGAFRGIPWLEPWALPVAVPVAFLMTAAIGAIMERGLIRHLYGRPLETLLLTFGIGMMLQQAVRIIFGAQNREVISPSWMQGTMMLFGEVPVTRNRLWIIVFSLVVLLATYAAMQMTRFGLEMRAVVQNRRIASAMGIRTGRVDAMTFAFGSGIAGIAGVALSQIDNVSPNLGTGYIIDSFMVVVFGGVGSLAGTLVGAMSLGVINKVLEPWSGAVLAKIFVLIAIMLFIQRRPKGLFALKGRAAE